MAEAYSPSVVSLYMPRRLAKVVTRALQRSTQRPWIPVLAHRAWTELAARAVEIPAGVTVTHGALGGRPCDRISAVGADPGRAVLYLHGGAYVVGSPRTHRGLAAQIALAAGAPVHLLDYRLGPEHKHPSALEDTVAAYLELLGSGFDPGSIVVAGDSAGAGLAVALGVRLRDAGEPLPGGLVLLNGWFDLTCSGASMTFNRRRDVGLRRDWTVHGGELYRGDSDPLDPELSVVRADLEGLPPTYVQVGNHDLLLSDSDDLVERARGAGVDVGYSKYEGMWHDFQLAAGQLREADDAMADLGRAFERLWAGRPFSDERSSNGSRNGRPTPSVAIIGAGFGGVGLGMSLKRAGIDSFTIYEKAERVGGVWRDNTYPGLTCDIPSHLYSFSFEPNPDWSRTYSPQPEILAYLERCVAEYGLDRNLRLGTEVARADFDADSARWVVTTAAGEEGEFDVVVSSCGQLSRPALAHIPGADRFEGPIFHTARWDHSVELEGKRVAVIGTGASTIQAVPAIAPRVGRLHVYQRSAPYVVPKKDRPYRAWERRLFRSFPPARLAVRFGQWLQFELFSSAYTRFKPLGRMAVRIAEKNLEEQVSDPELRRAFTPTDVIGCKRVLVSSEYYATFERPNAELVTEGVRELTDNAVVADDGTEREADVVVLSTGFESHSFLAPMEVRGLAGRELSEVWRTGANAYLGMTVAGFPNLFVMYGPNTNLGAGSIITQLESQMAYILDAIQRLRRTGGWLSVKAEVQESFDRALQERLADSVWLTGCSNWYVDEHGRDTNNWPGFTLEYRWLTRRLDPADYEKGQLRTSGL
jgi:cation diffusion facilitator CzcD-associated flavoprotein CzcO/acetyl esterase/lipase